MRIDFAIMGGVESGKTTMRIRDRQDILRNIVSFQRYSSSLAVSFDRNELQERVKKRGIELHFPEEGATVKGSLALLVGWAESRQKAMAKFAAIYTQQGIPCLTIAPQIQSMWFTSVGNKLTSRLIRALDLATPLGGQPVNLVMHLFSGGGQTVFPKLMEEVAKPNGLFNTKIKPRCIIFDSGPTRFSYESGMQAAKLLYQQGGFNYATYTASKLIGGTVNILVGSRKRSELSNALDSPLLAIPQLYLFSSADSVCRSEWVESVMVEQRRKGRTVESFMWKDSEHVRHLIQHPEDYERQVVQFLGKYFT